MWTGDGTIINGCMNVIILEMWILPTFVVNERGGVAEAARTVSVMPNNSGVLWFRRSVLEPVPLICGADRVIASPGENR